ncbi:hypothetical protein TSUD_281760 [Trifolium subterraneum]|uniref:Uncharacterized protein n=1 Tax=Trifolium subterraneum TaxID=3900 RepID=A0A2Z6LV06_TRISU|nr:hypothetical protein TSUD_281760 [Trifolium subterraneum]
MATRCLIDEATRRVRGNYRSQEHTRASYRLKHHLAGTSKDVDSCVVVEAEVAANSNGKRKSVREIARKDMFKRGVTTLIQTKINEAIQSSEAQSRSERLKLFRDSEEFRSSRMFRGLQEFRGCLIVLSHSEDEDVQKLNCEGLSEANHSKTNQTPTKVKLLCKGRRGFTQRIFNVYSCPSYNGNFSNVSMSFTTHINTPKKELMTSAHH